MSDAVEHPYFESETSVQNVQQSQCCLCLCDSPHMHPMSQGLVCGGGKHFTCNACLTAHVHHASIDAIRERNKREGRVRCPLAPLECDPEVSLMRQNPLKLCHSFSSYYVGIVLLHYRRFILLRLFSFFFCEHWKAHTALSILFLVFEPKQPRIDPAGILCRC